MIRGIYDLAFAYQDADPQRPFQAAGLAVRGSLRMFFTFRGAFFWRMQAAMGDVVFAPFYEVLKRRGVTFKFFHRLENLRLADPSTLAPGERSYVESLEFDVQAMTNRRSGISAVDRCARLTLLAVAARLRPACGRRIYRTRRPGFRIALGPPQGCFANLARRRKTSTLSFWALGWARFPTLPAISLRAISAGVISSIMSRPSPRRRFKSGCARIWRPSDGIIGKPRFPRFTHPFDTWADMRHLIAEESWPRSAPGDRLFL